MSTFARNVFNVLRGSAIAQLVGVAALPVISRLYEPQALGALQALISVLTFFVVLSSLRLEIAVLSVGDAMLANTVRSCMWICVLMSAALLVGVFALRWAFPEALGKIGDLAYVVPVAALLAGWGQVLTYTALRSREFNRSAAAKVSQSVSYAGGAIAAAPVWPSSLGLALADSLGRLSYCVVLWFGKFRESWSPGFPGVAVVGEVMRSNRPLITVSLPGALVNVLGSSYTSVMLLVIFAPAEAGQYALVERVIGAPIAMISQATSQVFMSGLAEAIRTGDGSGRGLFRRLIVSQMWIGLLPAAALFVLAPVVFPIVFGDSWREAGVYARVLSPLFLVTFIVSPVNMALTIAGKQALQFFWDVGRLAAIGGMWWMVHAAAVPTVEALILYAATAGACYLIYLYIADRAIGPRAASGAVSA